MYNLPNSKEVPSLSWDVIIRWIRFCLIFQCRSPVFFWYIPKSFIKLQYSYKESSALLKAMTSVSLWNCFCWKKKKHTLHSSSPFRTDLEVYRNTPKDHLVLKKDVTLLDINTIHINWMAETSVMRSLFRKTFV